MLALSEQVSRRVLFKKTMRVILSARGRPRRTSPRVPDRPAKRGKPNPRDWVLTKVFKIHSQILPPEAGRQEYENSVIEDFGGERRIHDGKAQHIQGKLRDAWKSSPVFLGLMDFGGFILP